MKYTFFKHWNHPVWQDAATLTGPERPIRKENIQAPVNSLAPPKAEEAIEIFAPLYHYFLFVFMLILAVAFCMLNLDLR